MLHCISELSRKAKYVAGDYNIAFDDHKGREGDIVEMETVIECDSPLFGG